MSSDEKLERDNRLRRAIDVSFKRSELPLQFTSQEEVRSATPVLVLVVERVPERTVAFDGLLPGACLLGGGSRGCCRSLRQRLVVVQKSEALAYARPGPVVILRRPKLVSGVTRERFVCRATLMQQSPTLSWWTHHCRLGGLVALTRNTTTCCFPAVQVLVCGVGCICRPRRLAGSTGALSWPPCR